MPNYIGNPPTCRPECTLSSDCDQTKACINQKCEDPCPGSCGLKAECSVVNHNPICTCRQGYTGDPFTACSIIGKHHFHRDSKLLLSRKIINILIEIHFHK